MDIRPLTEAFAVAPQIDPEDMPAIAAAGYRTILCNRPDDEVPPSHGEAAMRAAAEAAGLAFVAVPLVPGAIGPDEVARQGACADGPGPVLAYCRSGTRSCTVWALSRAGRVPPDELIACAAAQGYDLAPFRGALQG
ncbi:MAG: TIGR01244 family sulfur transferase [Shimia sp.]